MLRLAPLVLLAGLAACATRPPPPPEPPPGPPPGTDARYRGTARLIRSDNRYCPRSGPRVYEVENGTITLSYQGAGRTRVPLSAQVQPDGHFDATDGDGRLQGQLVNGLLEITIASRFCEHRWTLRPIP